jgi:hypothetical protein
MTLGVVLLFSALWTKKKHFQPRRVQTVIVGIDSVHLEPGFLVRTLEKVKSRI